MALDQFEIGSTQSWSVRYKGMIRTSQSGLYTFFFHKPPCDGCRVTFHLNGTLVSFGAARSIDSLISASVNVFHKNTLHDVTVRFQQPYHLDYLQFRMTYSCNSESAQVIPTRNMFPLAGKYIVKLEPRFASELRAEVFTFSSNPALTATFYSHLDFQSPYRVQEFESSYLECGMNCMPIVPVSIRWSGFHGKSISSTLAVLFGGSFCHSSLKLWIDDMLFADLIQPAGVGDFSRYVNFRSRNFDSLRDLKIEYSKLQGHATLSLNFSNGVVSPNVGSLYSRSQISSAVGTLQVKSSEASASRSSLLLHTATVTAGRTFYATLSLFDRFDNALHTVVFPSASIVHGSCDLSSTTQISAGSASVSHISMHLYNISSQVSNLFDGEGQGINLCLRLFLMHSDVPWLNYTLHAVPDKVCAALSRSFGGCLTLSKLCSQNLTRILFVTFMVQLQLEFLVSFPSLHGIVLAIFTLVKLTKHFCISVEISVATHAIGSFPPQTFLLY
jgi:hypothetical protein